MSFPSGPTTLQGPAIWQSSLSVTATVPWGSPLANWLFAGLGGAVTVTGFFVDNTGTQVGVSVTYSVGASNPGTFVGASFAAIAGGAVPAGAVYFIMRVASGSLYYSTGAVTKAADFKANTTNYPVLIAIPDYQMFGGSA